MVKPRLVRHMRRPRLVRILPMHFPVVRFQRVRHMHRPRLVRTLPTHFPVVRLQRVPVKVCDLTVRPGPIIQREQPCLVLSIQMVRQRVPAAQEAREHRGVLNSRLVLLKTLY